MDTLQHVKLEQGAMVDYMPPTILWGFFFVATLVVLTLVEKMQRHFTSLRQVSQCVKETATIFVAITNFSGAVAGGRCLFSLFEHAKCPFRIKVGIYEASYTPRAVAVSYYEQLQRRFSTSSNVFSSNIKSSANSTRNGGTYVARQAIIESAYNNEDYILTLHDGVEMLQNWDVDLIALANAHKQKKENIVIVAPPAPIQSMSILSLALFGFSTSVGLEPRYPIIGGFSDSGLPLHASKPFLGGAQPDGLQSLFWSSACSFAPSGFFVDSKTSALEHSSLNTTLHLDSSMDSNIIVDTPPLCHAIPRRKLPNLFQDDTLVTCDGMASGWQFQCAPKCVSKLYYEPESSVLSTRSGIPLDEIQATSKLVRDLLHKELGPYLQEVGLFKKASAKAFSGIVNVNNSIEVENKHGRGANVPEIPTSNVGPRLQEESK